MNDISVLSWPANTSDLYPVEKVSNAMKRSPVPTNFGGKGGVADFGPNPTRLAHIIPM